ncbi:MAG: SDR family oxidoreductase [Alphaproteobacteria bacterium]|nr:SDR family oxidoreductase [Alphaproteobacteria bacterium]
MHDLAGRVALITGASRGIGAAAARALAEAGAAVALLARDGAAAGNVARQIDRAGGRALALACDIAQFNAVEHAVATARQRLGQPDILINNAGVIEPIGRLWEVPPEVWGRSIAVNLTGAYHVIRAVLPGMLASGRGTVVNVSSGAAHRPLEGWSAYCAGKAGLAMLTRSLLLETADRGIRVFGLSPGTVDTDMQVAIRASGINPVSQLPRASLAPVEEPAAAIVYLCTAAADALIGQEVSARDDAFRRRAGLP